MNIPARFAVLLPFCVLTVACVFDSQGVPAGRDSGPADLSDALRPDRLVPDTTLPSVCAKVPPPAGNICLFESGGDAIGQSGTCAGGTFQRARYCFSLAPCQAGTCRPMCTNDCRLSPCGAAEVCTALFAGSSVVKHCCVEPAPKSGDKGAGDSCTKNDECTTGLCNLNAGNCFEPCVDDTGCSKGFGCKPVKVTEGKLEFDLNGCLPGTQDAGVDSAPPDAGVDSAAPDAGVDSAAPEAGVDSAPPDAGMDSAAPEAGVDSAPPDAGMDSVDAPKPLDGATPVDVVQLPGA